MTKNESCDETGDATREGRNKQVELEMVGDETRDGN